MSFWETIRDALRNKSQMINWIAWFVIFFVFTYLYYEKLQLDKFFIRGLIDVQTYGDMTAEIRRDLLISYNAVILYLFAKALTKSE